MNEIGLTPAAVVAVLVRPHLWGTAMRQLFRLAPRQWWHQSWVPRPDPAYMAFRRTTAYGDATHAIEPHDLVTYLKWRKAWDSVVR